MMRLPFCGARRPPWWPENERWPPRGPIRAWRGRPLVFMRFAAFAFLGVTAFLVWSVLTVAFRGPASALLFAAALVAGSLALSVGVFTRRVAVPVSGIMDALERVAAGDYETRVAERGPLRIRALARAFNAMTGRLRDHERARRDLMADVAHELRTPLTVMQGTLEGMLDGVYPRDEQRVQQLLSETQVLARLVEDLRTLALSESGALALQRERIDLAGVARDVADAFAAEAASRAIALNVSRNDALVYTDADPVRIRQALSNLVSNALHATPAGGAVTVAVGATANNAWLSVADTGRGMTAEELAHAFDRFHKGSDSRGSGLGLTIAKNIVTLHGGRMQATSEAGRGTTVQMTIPVTT
jgi:signal transduction histidine kinase